MLKSLNKVVLISDLSVTTKLTSQLEKLQSSKAWRSSQLPNKSQNFNTWKITHAIIAISKVDYHTVFTLSMFTERERDKTP